MHIPASVRQFILNALEEDIGSGDITSEALIPEEHTSTAVIIAKQSFILAGMPFVKEVFRCVDETVKFKPLAKEGARVKNKDILAKITGKTRALLASERVALNILQRLSGTATLTNEFAKRIKGFKAKVLDTRKTTPGMRYMEKYAVRTGGGQNHRFALYDGILIKDNHIKAAEGIKKAIRLARKNHHLLKIEIEVQNLKELKEALSAGADVIMLDNMPLKDIKEAVRLSQGKALLEVSGNVTLDNIREIAETGVDFISIGALTHSAPAVDISMKIT
jgi:nicotinate-nucleotide pyrophosphorylase (carboxylating)